MKEAFFQLVLEEIRCQPGLEKEIQDIQLAAEARAVVPRLLGLVPGRVGGLVREAVDLVWKQGRAQARAARTAADLEAAKQGDPYVSQCRSALVYLFFGDTEAAEYAVNLAKQRHDDWAFAHHVYGLTRCLQDRFDDARFELHLAREREPDEGARGRIAQALGLAKAEQFFAKGA